MPERGTGDIVKTVGVVDDLGNDGWYPAIESSGGIRDGAWSPCKYYRQ
jgi:hypothetical protein